MKKTIVGIASILAMCINAFASPVSLPAKAAIRWYEKAAAKLGLRTAGEMAVHGGTKLAAVTAEREIAKQAAGSVAGDIAKHVTAGKLFAAGGGTALVVAAHETADGVQQMGEGVKEAVASNPEIATDVAETITAPIKWVATMAGAAILAFLAWFIWPWALLARNWSKLAAAKRTVAMQKTVPAPNTAGDVIDVVSMTPDAARPGFTRVELIIVIAGFLLLSVIGAWRIVHSGISDGDKSKTGHGAAVSQKARVAERTKKIAQLQAEYVAALDRHYATFLTDVESEASARFGEVRDEIPSVAKKFGAISRCRDLLTAFVKDKLSKGNRAEQGIKRDLEADFYRGLYDAHDKVNVHLVTFLKNAEADRRSFISDLKVELDSIELPGDEKFKALLADGGDCIENSKRELAGGQVVAAVDAVFEAAGVQFTVSTAANLLGKAAARIAGSAAVGAGMSLADGPLPFLDIAGGIAVLGTTAWSIRDIYRAAKTLPAELQKTLRSVVDDCESQTVAETKNAGAKIHEAFSCAGN